MTIISENFLKLTEQYVFSEVAKRVKVFKKEHPTVNVLNFGIGDVVLPVPEVIVSAIKIAASEMNNIETFKGYGPYAGYDFLKEKIKCKYNKNSVNVDLDEIFIGCGSKEDIAGILDLFTYKNNVLIQNPVYPAYLDMNIIKGTNFDFILSNEENDFLPLPDETKKSDIIYLCSPNNPTGVSYTKKQLEHWVNYALSQNSVIFFDGAYEGFIEDEDIPHSIYEIPGSKKCAIEFRSFSKTAGFTGIRCSYIIVPNELIIGNDSLNILYKRLISSKTNGVSYITQKAAEAVFSDIGQNEISNHIKYYKKNVKILSEALKIKNIKIFGQNNSPYIWLKCPKNMNSWDFFDYLLMEAAIVGTPGIGFGSAGENYFRLSSFALREHVNISYEKLLTLDV